MASNKKKPMVKKPQNKKPAVKPATKKVVAKKPVAKKPVVKKPVTKPVETKVEQVSIASQIPAAICPCTTSCKKSHKKVYIIAGVIIVALLLAILF